MAKVALILPHNRFTRYLVYSLIQHNRIVFINYSLGESLINYQLNSFGAKRVISARQLEYTLNINPKHPQRRVTRIDSPLGVLYYAYHVIRGYLFLKTKRYKDSFLDKSLYLYTSGTSGYPKGVEYPLLKVKDNIEGWLAYVLPRKNESMLVTLPYFHSFGINTGLIFPLLQDLGYLDTDIRFIYDYRIFDPVSLGETIQVYKPDYMIISPYFLELLLDHNTHKQLGSIHSIYLGGDFTSEQLLHKCNTILPNTKIYKGYGLTECFPILALVPRSDTMPSTKTDGKLLSFIDAKIIDKDGEIQEYGKGELLIHLDYVIHGYLDSDFHVKQYKNSYYFNTHDYVYLYKNKFITVLGRTRRIIKKGDEIINIDYLQGLLQQQFHGVCHIITDQIYFFTTDSISLETINIYIFNLGLSRHYFIDHVHVVEHIPLLSVGKIDYHTLETYL